MNSKITGIDKLIFFNEKGYEIPMQKTYTIQWELIPNEQVSNNFISNPAGHFIYDLNSNENDIQIETVVDNKGKVINCPVNVYSSDSSIIEKIENVKDILLLNISKDYTHTIGHFKNRNNGEYKTIDKTITDDIFNTVKITFNTLNESYVENVPVNLVFNDVTYTEYKQISYNSNDSDNIPYVSVNSLSLTELPTGLGNPYGYKTLLHGLIDSTFGFKQLFPCVRYMGSTKQDKVSTEFIAASTVIILLENNNTYIRPSFGNEYTLRFLFQDDTEMRFISSDSINNIIWKDQYQVDTTPINTPIHFSVGFQTSVEGCYQNIMAIYLIDLINNKKYILGLITFLTEAEDEDERYRALLGNLGIPDPIKYPNIFKCQDPKEQGIDWTLINTKSKELMINYDNIFPYVGTYKALLGAVKFLGYQDLIFKEWYRIKDLNNRDKYIAIQTYDLKRGETLLSKLKKAGVNFGEFERYKKINRLTMIYHLNEIDDETGEVLPIYSKRKDLNNKFTTSPDSGLYKAVNPDTKEHYAEYDEDFSVAHEQFFQLPITYKVYEYRSDEILAKLYSVKQWLEKYILGVNCYISDICGEGIIIERMKSLAYVTNHYLNDLTVSGKFTPKITHVDKFIDSSTYITCSLNEFDSLTFADYEDYNIEAFIRKTIIKDNKTIYVSAPLETLVVADEYLFQLTNNNVLSGTLYEFTDENYIDNPVLIEDNEIMFYSDVNNMSKIDKNKLPIIEVSQCNIRYCHGNWKDNIAFSVNIAIDQKTGNQVYTLYNRDTGDIIYKGQHKVWLYPNINNSNISKYKLYWTYLTDKSNNLYDGKDSEFMYTSNTKWNLPMFIMRNYKCKNVDEILPGDFILEIISGRILFKNNEININNGEAAGCEILFGQEYESKEQPISASYTYISDRVPIYTFNAQLLKNNPTEDDITSCVSTNRYVNVNVNRIGSYLVAVSAYDSYNNMFVNKSDDITTVNANPIEINTVINSKYVNNNKDFYEKDVTGNSVLQNEEIKKQLLDIGGPLLPLTYRIYDINAVTDDSNIIEYDNLSYAIDTPKPGDFIIFNNFTDRVLSIIKESDNIYKLNILDENPNIDIIRNADLLGLCIYSNIQKDVIGNIYPVKKTEIYISLPDTDTYDGNKSYIKIDISGASTDCALSINDLISKELNNDINVYLYSIDELEINESNISVNIKKKTTSITVNGNRKFVENQVVKICVANDNIKAHNNYTLNTIDNETSYRIVKCKNIGGSSYEYTLNGIVDVLKIIDKVYKNVDIYTTSSGSKIKLLQVPENNAYKLKLCPAHLKGIQYILRINTFGEEVVQRFNKGSVIKTLVLYEPTPLLLNNYLDTTYSAYVCDYDPYMLQNIWNYDIHNYSDLYYYSNTPVTVNKGQSLILMPNVNNKTLTNRHNIKVIWDWKSYIVEDHTNWHKAVPNISKQTIFKSVNKVVSVKPELLGTQSIQMSCYDIYGNKLTNPGDGFVYVKGNDYIVHNKQKNIKDRIYYKDVYIVGFSYLFIPLEVLSMSGESNTYTISKYGVSSKKTKPIELTYKIYYSDGSIKENEGAKISLLTANNKVSKNNLVNVKVARAKHLHKQKVSLINGKFIIENTSENDLINSEQLFNIDILLYGTSVTERIYNLTFDVKDIPAEGIQELDTYILLSYITNIKYDIYRSEGITETMTSDNFNDSMLRIIDYKFMHNQYGDIRYIPENTIPNRNVGLLQITVLFIVNGIEKEITTTGISQIYQK